jgi:hypothetical protein
MMVFIPISDLYNSSQAFRAKLQFNHEKYIGDETFFCIGGFNNLNNSVLLKNGNTISLCLLLKSIPATEGMSRPQLFQQVEPNNGATVTIVTFQNQDKEFVIARQETLEEEIRNVIAPGQELQVFVNDIKGIWFGGVNKNRNGIKLSSFSHKNKEEAEYTAHINRIMNSPPKKRVLNRPNWGGGIPSLALHNTINTHPQNQQRNPIQPTNSINVLAPLKSQQSP